MKQNVPSRALPSSPPALCCSQPSSSLLCSSFLSLRVLDMGVGRLGERQLDSHVTVTIVTIQWQILRKKWHETPGVPQGYPCYSLHTSIHTSHLLIPPPPKKEKDKNWHLIQWYASHSSLNNHSHLDFSRIQHEELASSFSKWSLSQRNQMHTWCTTTRHIWCQERPHPSLRLRRETCRHNHPCMFLNPPFHHQRKARLHYTSERHNQPLTSNLNPNNFFKTLLTLQEKPKKQTNITHLSFKNLTSHCILLISLPILLSMY